jgi:hypothetical protein
MIPTTGLVAVTAEMGWYAIPRVALFLYSLALVAFKLQLLRESRASAPPSAGGRQSQGAGEASSDHRDDRLPRVQGSVGG